ncbi:hypothetical protein [Neorhodopirellula pilleata]|nr:hypothetical protein [Neorhodopirellula pilleata]
MNRRQVVDVLGGKFDTFKRVPGSTETIYAYDDEFVHLTFGEDGLLKIISIFRPRCVSYCGTQLLGRAILDVLSDLTENAIETQKEDGGYWIEQAGILLVEIKGLVDGIELYAE